MAKTTSKMASTPVKVGRPALTPEARDNQLAALAVNLAEKQLRDGTASSQVITHYLKLAADREKRKLEIEKMELENELTKAKTQAIKDGEKRDSLFLEALEAFRGYAGHGGPDDE